MEEWKTIDWIENLKSTYEVSNKGRVRRVGGNHHTFYGEKYIESGYELKTSIASNGYPTVTFYPHGVLTHFYVHRLVAMAFIPNPNSYECINHINEIRTDNRVENLEWCTTEYNARYSSYKNRHPAKIYKKGEYGRNIRFRKGKYEVNCYIGGVANYLGRFESVLDARTARNNFWEKHGLLDYLTDEERLLRV